MSVTVFLWNRGAEYSAEAHHGRRVTWSPQEWTVEARHDGSGERMGGPRGPFNGFASAQRAAAELVATHHTPDTPACVVESAPRPPVSERPRRGDPAIGLLATAGRNAGTVMTAERAAELLEAAVKEGQGRDAVTEAAATHRQHHGRNPEALLEALTRARTRGPS